MSVKKQIWLINTLKANPAGLTLPELSALWQESDLNDGRPLSRTTLFRLRDAILSAYGLLIECSRSGGARYRIANPKALHEPTVRNWMLSSLTVSHLLGDSLPLKDRILMENIPTNGDTLRLILQAMKQQCRLRFVYHKYTDPIGNAGSQHWREVEPYALKLFRQRWYLLGHTPEHKERPFSVYSLDRILSPAISPRTFRMPADFSATEYFADSFGVMREQNTPPVHIVLRAYGTAPAYLRDLPLHPSQRELPQPARANQTNQANQPNQPIMPNSPAPLPFAPFADFALYLRPTPDFLNALMSFGPAVQVLQPADLALRIKQRLNDTLRRYR